MTLIKIKRVYDPQEEDDGYRMLVDRLWPRGLKKEMAGVDHWAKEVAPSSDLRKWFDHEPQKWQVFQLRYEDELKENKQVDDLIDLIRKNKTVTLLYAAHDNEHTHAIVLQRFLQRKVK